jgi:hypothetical protein
MSISKEREENNGIQWTENQVPEEVEVQPRMVTEEVTGAPLRMKLSKPKVSLLKVRPLPLLKSRVRKLRLRPLKSQRLRSKKSEKKLLKKRKRRVLLLKNSELKERMLVSRRKPERPKKLRRPTLKKLTELVIESLEFQTNSRTKSSTVLPRDKMLNSSDSKLVKTNSTQAKREEVEEAAEEAVVAEVAVVAEAEVMPATKVLDHQEEETK